MTFDNIQCFLTAAEEMNFTKAAQKLYISQQTLSGHIAKIEEEYGCKLFNRTSPLSLTPEGVIFLRKAQSLANIEKDLRKELIDQKDFQNGNLSIGITRSRGSTYLTPVLSKFHNIYPNIRLEVVEGSVNEIEDALHKAKVDVTIGFPPQNGRNVESLVITKEHISAIIPSSIMDSQLIQYKFKLLPDGRKVDWMLFKDCPFVSVDPRFEVGKPFVSICNTLGISPQIILESKSVDTALQFCLSGLGILVCSEVFLNAFVNKSKLHNTPFYIYPWDDSLSKDICVNFLKTKYCSMATKKFIGMMLDEYKAARI